jgi:hypothetical protein
MTGVTNVSGRRVEGANMPLRESPEDADSNDDGDDDRMCTEYVGSKQHLFDLITISQMYTNG